MTMVSAETLSTTPVCLAVMRTPESKATRFSNPVPTSVTDRDYGPAVIALENRLAGIPHYHTSAAWLWLGAWHIVALARVGRLQEAEVLLHRIDQLIVRDGIVHEVYDKKGRFLSTFWYTSEAPLTWSAGMIVHARAVYQRALAREDYHD